MAYMFHRFELYCGDEPQNIGFIAGLDKISISDYKKTALLDKFSKELSNPDAKLFRSLRFAGIETRSWFTQKGAEHFKEEIRNLRRVYKNSPFHIVETKANCLNSVVYADEYQVFTNTPIH